MQYNYNHTGKMGNSGVAFGIDPRALKAGLARAAPTDPGCGALWLYHRSQAPPDRGHPDHTIILCSCPAPDDPCQLWRGVRMASGGGNSTFVGPRARMDTAKEVGKIPATLT